MTFSEWFFLTWYNGCRTSFLLLRYQLCRCQLCAVYHDVVIYRVWFTETWSQSTFSCHQIIMSRLETSVLLPLILLLLQRYSKRNMIITNNTSLLVMVKLTGIIKIVVIISVVNTGYNLLMIAIITFKTRGYILHRSAMTLLLIYVVVNHWF